MEWFSCPVPQRKANACIPVLQEVVFREDSEKGGLGVAQRSCFGVQGSCFLSSLSEGIELPQMLVSCSVVLLCVSGVCVCISYTVDRGSERRE